MHFAETRAQWSMLVLARITRELKNFTLNFVSKVQRGRGPRSATVALRYRALNFYQSTSVPIAHTRTYTLSYLSFGSGRRESGQKIPLRQVLQCISFSILHALGWHAFT